MDQKNKKKKQQNSEFEFCIVCHRNHDEGQRHKYFPSHTKSLSNFLSRFQNKLNEIRFFLKNPSVLRFEHASRNRFWCVFCDCDIDELCSSFACQNAINHLARGDHLKNLKHFLWKYGGGMDRVDAFRISEAEIAKWEKNCKSFKSEAAPCGGASQGLLSGPSNDIHKELDFENLNNFGKNTLHHLNSNMSNVVMPLQHHTNEYQVSHWEHSGVANVGSKMHVITTSLSTEACRVTSLWNSNNLMVNENGVSNGTHCSSDVSLNKGMYRANQEEKVVSREIIYQGLQNITQVASSVSREVGGNVHSGAPAPWFEAAEIDQLNIQLKPVSAGFASLNESGRSKLNPKRVGAAWAEKRKMEMEMEKRGEIVESYCDPNWLPNFGRVWQSGTRKESRKEFEFEKQKQPNVHSLSEMSMQTQPYVSKRMRRDAADDSGDPRLN